MDIPALSPQFRDSVYTLPENSENYGDYSMGVNLLNVVPPMFDLDSSVWDLRLDKHYKLVDQLSANEVKKVTAPQSIEGEEDKVETVHPCFT